MNDTSLASLSGILLSLSFSYIPGLKNKYAGLLPDNKRLVMLGSLLVAAFGIFALSCAGYSSQVTCDMAGAEKLVGLFVSAMIANQAAYMITPASK